MFRLLGAGAMCLALFGCAAGSKVTREWREPLNVDHPLVGKVYDVRHQRFVTLKELESAVRAADLVVLGENHDNADHHRLQAHLVEAAASKDRRPAVALEMLDTSLQPTIESAWKTEPGQVDAFAEAVGWEKSGWPAFELYRPIFVTAAEQKLPIIAANLPRTEARAAVREGSGALNEPVRNRLAQDGPLPEAVDRAMQQEIRESHCNALPEMMVHPMVLVQRARDAQLALRTVEGATADGAVLITGAGHARTDRGVPVYLARDAPGKRVLSVGFIEAEATSAKPSDYSRRFGTGALPFDYVVFTPGADRGDPCERFRQQLPTQSSREPLRT